MTNFETVVAIMNLLRKGKITSATPNKEVYKMISDTPYFLETLSDEEE